MRGKTNSRAAMSLSASPPLTIRTTSRSVGVSEAQPLQWPFVLAATALGVGGRSSVDSAAPSAHADHRGRHQIGIGDRRQTDPPHPATKSVSYLSRHLRRQPRLADTSRAGKRHKPIVGQDLPRLINVGFATDETRQPSGKVLATTVSVARKAG